MDGKYYVRAKSSLTRKRGRKDPAFKKTMHNAAILANASKIASALYKELKADCSVQRTYGQGNEAIAAREKH